ncbi:MAG: tyrosine-type recombinase/integrase [Pseudomonadota bacterium]
MARLTDMELAKAFVAKTAPSFEDTMARVRDLEGYDDSRIRDFVSGLTRVADAIGWPVAECPADPVWLRSRIANVRPAALGISKKTWTNTVSNAKSALAAIGLLERERGRPLELSKDWKGLWELALATRDKNITIPGSRFVRFCSNVEIAPDAVCDETIQDFQRALELTEIRKDPASATWQAIHAWNKSVDKVPGWPQTRLTKPVRHTHFAIPLAEFPTPFRTELEALIARLAKPILELGAKRRRPLSSRTINHRERQWIRFASALVHAGIAIENLQSLRDLLEINRVERGIEWLSETRHGGQTSPGLRETALGLCTLGRELGIDDAHLGQLREIASILSENAGDRRVRKKGLTEKNRKRLRQFRDPARQHALLRLPTQLMDEARRINQPVKAARHAEVAIAITIELVAPLRLKNLAGLDLDRHFDRAVPGHLYLTIPEYEVKNGAPLEFELPERIGDMLDVFLAEHRPHLIKAPCPWLFAREDGTDHVHQSVLARRINETISDRLGLEMNVHLFRHLAARLILEQDPAAFDLVRRILGHSEVSTTIDAYGGLESLKAAHILSDLVDQAEAEHPARPLQRRKPCR